MDTVDTVDTVDTADPPTAGEVTDFAWRTIVTGYLTRDAVIDAVTAYARGSLAPAEANDLVQGLWQQRLRAQQRWPATTDCDRLDAAFTGLTELGVLARQHYGCCLRHGVDAITAERAAAGAGGFVLFSEPDTAAAVEGLGLYLAFGAITLADATDADKARRVCQVGTRVVQALRAAGLQTDWRGGADDRIWVGLDWERRVPDGILVP